MGSSPKPNRKHCKRAPTSPHTPRPTVSADSGGGGDDGHNSAAPPGAVTGAAAIGRCSSPGEVDNQPPLSEVGALSLDTGDSGARKFAADVGAVAAAAARTDAAARLVASANVTHSSSSATATATQTAPGVVCASSLVESTLSPSLAALPSIAKAGAATTATAAADAVAVAAVVAVAAAANTAAAVVVSGGTAANSAANPASQNTEESETPASVVSPFTELGKRKRRGRPPRRLSINREKSGHFKAVAVAPATAAATAACQNTKESGTPPSVVLSLTELGNRKRRGRPASRLSINREKSGHFMVSPVERPEGAVMLRAADRLGGSSQAVEGAGRRSGKQRSGSTMPMEPRVENAKEKLAASVASVASGRRGGSKRARTSLIPDDVIAKVKFGMVPHAVCLFEFPHGWGRRCTKIVLGLDERRCCD